MMVYAIFAGWHAEHADIYEVPRGAFNPSQLQEAERLLDGPSHQGIDELEILGLTFFFGERAVLAVGQRNGQAVGVVSDGLETLVMPCEQRPTAMTPDLVLALFRGRKLLRSFQWLKVVGCPNKRQER